MFGRDKNKLANEKTLYEGRPSFLIYCKSIFLAMIVLGVLFSAYTAGTKMIGNMNVFLISSTKMHLTEYYALAILILMIVVFFYIVWKVLSWTTVKYTITNYRVIVKKGLISENKTYMPFNTIQDVNRSQNILGKIISVGTISLYSAFDGKTVELKDIFSPSKVEDIIFENMRNPSLQPRNLYENQNNNPGIYASFKDKYGQNEESSGILSSFRNKKPQNEGGNYHNYGNVFDNQFNNYDMDDAIIPEHAMSDGPINDISDLNDLELVDVKQRKRNLRNMRKNARRNNYDVSRNNPRGYNQNPNKYSSYRNRYVNNNYGGNYQNADFQSPYNKDYAENIDNTDYIAGPSYYNQQNNINSNYSHQVRGNSNYHSVEYQNHHEPYYSNDEIYVDHSRDMSVTNDYDEIYIQHDENNQVYEPIHTESIRNSYRQNPDKYFADNYEKFHENNRNPQRGNFQFNNNYYEEYEISDAEFDRTLEEANKNLDSSIKFRNKNPNYNSRKEYSHNNFNVHNSQNNYDSRNSQNYSNYSYKPHNHRNYNSNYNKYNNKSRNYNKYHSRDSNQYRNPQNNQYAKNRNEYNNYSQNENREDYSKESKSPNDIFKNHSKKFNKR